MSSYSRVMDEIADAAIGCGRNPKEITLIAVTKTVPWEKAALLYAEGQHDFGESRLPEALKKKAEAPKDCCWHLIGTLQSNKVRKAVGNFVMIHSVDTLELAKKISECSLELGVKTSILLQVNTSGEATKHGLDPEQWKRNFDEVLRFPALSIDGLMTMAPLIDDEVIIRRCFRHLRETRDELAKMAGERCSLMHLSMGMSHDFAFAIEEGATLVRIGSALFT